MRVAIEPALHNECVAPSIEISPPETTSRKKDDCPYFISLVAVADNPVAVLANFPHRDVEVVYLGDARRKVGCEALGKVLAEGGDTKAVIP